jgi:hypothetical protein
MTLSGTGRSGCWRVIAVAELLFGAPAGWLLDVWLALPSGYVLGPAVSGLVLAGTVWVLRRAGRQARWPDGKP